MSNVRVAITLNSVNLTSFNITITNFGSSTTETGTSADVYTVLFRNNDLVPIENYELTTDPNYFTLNVPQTISFNNPGWNITPVARVEDAISVQVDNLTKTTINPSVFKNDFVTGGSDTPPTITATADYTNGITITITNVGTGSVSNTFNLLLDAGIPGTAQTKNGLTGFTEGTPITIPWSEFLPPGLQGRVGGDPITIKLYNFTGDINSNIINANLTGGGGGGIPCFVAASNLLTPTGYKAVKDIKTGDLLMTADGRQVPVKSFSYTVKQADKDSAPFLIPANSLSPSCPKTDLKLSPWHAIQTKKGLWMKPMSALELGMPVQQYDLGKSVTYYHFEAPNFFKDNFVCEGTVVESFGGLQTKDMKGRVYTYNANLNGYTRAASKSVSKAIMM